jgi:TRAP-type C4-dicarboxylate transport system substrate-binding protein
VARRLTAATALRRTAAIVLALMLDGASAAEPVKINISGYLLPGSSSDALFKAYAARLSDTTEPRLAPKLLIYGEAGSEEQVLAGLRRGRIHVGSVSALALSSLIPEMEVTKIPFLFDDAAEFDAIVDTVLMPEFEATIADKDLTVLRWIDLGGLSLFGKKPLLSPADVRGYRMRASSDAATQAFFRALGADLVFVTAPEMVPSLQTGLLDGGAITTTAYAQTGLAPEAPHLTVTGHAYLGALLLANRSWLNALPAQAARQVRDGFASNAAIRAFFRAEADRLLAEAEARGFSVHRLTPVERQSWAEAVAASRDEIVAGSGPAGQVMFDKIAAARRLRHQAR